VDLFTYFCKPVATFDHGLSIIGGSPSAEPAQSTDEIEALFGKY
jgi:hypothetical protein